MKKLYPILLALIILGAGCKTADNISSTKTKGDFDMQSKCANLAKKFFDDKGYRNQSGFDFQNYTNHYNSKLDKCFIFITLRDNNKDFTSLDLFDAVEGGHYAQYTGHDVCNAGTLYLLNDVKRCQQDTGDIWLNGNDSGKPDFKFGFDGATAAGDENTQAEYIEKVNQIINN